MKVAAKPADDLVLVRLTEKVGSHQAGSFVRCSLEVARSLRDRHVAVIVDDPAHAAKAPVL